MKPLSALTSALVLVLLPGPVAAQAPSSANTATLALFAGQHIGRPFGTGLPIDPNGFLFNPRWLIADTAAPNIEARCRFRVAHGHLDFRALLTTRPDCLSPAERATVTLAESSETLFLGVACATSNRTGNVRGHVNYVPATVTGQLRWVGYSRTPGDRDFTLDLVARTPNAATVHNTNYGRGRAYHVEFYRDETFRRLEGTQGTSWWYGVDRDRHDKEQMRDAVDGRFAIVTGLLGLDGVHGFHTELHPVYAMFVLINASRVGDGWDEEWAVMLRNTGTEGDCSAGRMAMYTPAAEPFAGTAPEQDYTVDLGWWEGASGARVSLTSSGVDPEHHAIWSHQAGAAPAVRADPMGRHLYIGFRHQRPRMGAADFLFLGGLRVHWTMTSPTGAGSSVDRLADWLPESCPDVHADRVVLRGRGGVQRYAGCRALTLTPLPLADGPSVEGNKGAAKPGARALALVNPVDTLESYPAGELGPLPVERQHAPVFAPEPGIPWHERRRIERFCNQMSTDRRDPLCLGPHRWVVAMGIAGNAGKWQGSPFIGFQLREHSLGVPVLDGFAHRIELRRDHFLSRAAGTRSERLTEGWSLRWSPILAPNSLPLFSNVSVTPYLVFGPGVSVIRHNDWNFTFSYGGGMHLQLGRQEAFVEYQLYSRWGGYEFGHGINAGLILAWPFFQ